MHSKSWFLFSAMSMLIQLLLCFLGALQAYETDPGAGVRAMTSLAGGLRSAEKAVGEGDFETLLGSTAEMKRAIDAFPTMTPQINGDLREVFDGYASNLAYQISGLSDAAAGRQQKTAQIVDDIRRTCVSCHAKFRNTTDKAGRYPDRANVITGEVKILRRGGGERVDRSNVVVFLDRVKAGTDWPSPVTPPSLSQEGREFSPRVLPVTRGTTVDFPNDDTIFHNVFSLSKTKPFDLDIYRPGKSKSVTFSKPGWVKIYCNMHGQMTANIIVLDNPYFALTDRKGLFVIPDVPNGEYVLRTWHEYGKEQRARLSVSGRSTTFQTFTILEDKKLIPHTNKFGQPYTGKY